MDPRLVVGAALTWLAGVMTVALNGIWLALHGLLVALALVGFAAWVRGPWERGRGLIRRRAAGRTSR